MKLIRLFTAVPLIVTLAIVSCKGKSAKDYIVNKWKITEISGKEAADIPDSVKAKMYATATMEFTKDGKFTGTDMGPDDKTGVYSISDDNKSLISKNDNLSKADTLNILEISADKMVLEDKKGDMKVSFRSN
jgi:hypothetical protein